MMNRGIALFFALFALAMLAAVFAPAQAQETACALVPRLTVGHAGRVSGEVSVNVRSEPTRSGARIGLLSEYEMFSVLEGPVCAEGYHWWRVQTHHVREAINGWAAEGDAQREEYWLKPRGQRVSMGVFPAGERFGVVLADGTVEPEGCLAPPENYARVSIGRAQLNRRTLFMLEHAQRLYEAMGGFVQFRQGITQGSYTGGALVASFGTHDGGGAVDLSVRSVVDGSVLEDQIALMIEALRVAGFAAWLRDANQLYAGSPIHIHAIAIGDRELSPAALEQIIGERGYLAGWDALPPEWGGPNPDQHGGPLICAWMREAVQTAG